MVTLQAPPGSPLSAYHNMAPLQPADTRGPPPTLPGQTPRPPSPQPALNPESYLAVFALGATQSDTIPLIEQFQEWKVLNKAMECSHCHTEMKWMKDTKITKHGDGYFWKCFEPSCTKRYCTKSIRFGSMFEKSKLSLKVWLHLIYNYSMQTGVVKTANVLDLNVDTVSLNFATLRGFITIHLEQNPIMLGGIGKELQIAESC